ncbi:flagellin [Clostridium sp. SYSU_GA19001]|uniref:flagellin n=1 Tax=Clostridium caldaquaticum TaxID=2940653 RepID=UPI002076EB12|nr:flagellin [Clostridium caldaquaticum]MCM8710965.1 flagellin [Clostridium caldaquaticum]
MRLSQNLASLNIYKEQSKILNKQSTSLGRISSGIKANKAKDDPNAIAQSERFRMQIRGAQMASRNVQDGISMLQTFDGALGSINEMLIRVRELAVKAGNGTNSLEDKKIIQNEIDQLMKGIDDVAAYTEFNGIKLIGYDKVMNNDAPVMKDMPVGNNPDEKVQIPMYDLSSSKLLGIINVTDSNGIDSAIESIDKAINMVTSISSKYGALENRFESSYENLNEISDKMQSAESSVRDVDIAEEMIEFAKNNILIDAGNALMAQTNKFPQEILRILENVRG